MTWKNNIESKGLKVSIGKTKIMKCGTNEGPVFLSSKNLCGVVCAKKRSRWKLSILQFLQCIAVSANTGYTRYSGFKGQIIDTPDFKCHNCLHPPESEKEVHKFKLGNLDYKKEISSTILEICLVLVVEQKQAQ